MADGTPVEVSFEIPETKKPISAKGEVVRTIKFSEKHPERKVGIGIRFVEFHGDSEKRLEKCLEKTSNKDSRMIYYL